MSLENSISSKAWKLQHQWKPRGGFKKKGQITISDASEMLRRTRVEKKLF